MYRLLYLAWLLLPQLLTPERDFADGALAVVVQFGHRPVEFAALHKLHPNLDEDNTQPLPGQ